MKQNTEIDMMKTSNLNNNWRKEMNSSNNNFPKSLKKERSLITKNSMNGDNNLRNFFKIKL